MRIEEVMALAPVIPVLTFERLDHVVPVVEALVAAGLRAIEVTLRTPIALEAIAMAADVPGAVAGAGTVLSPASLDAAMAAGARFVVSPGLTDRMADAARDAGVAYLPGIATAGDLMRGYDHGLRAFKFFPAETSGGLRALDALSKPFGDARFCPTGGITAQSAATWLAHPKVVCVGGTWMVSDGRVDVGTIGSASDRAVG